MYLEISARQCGKTDRLIHAIYLYLTNNLNKNINLVLLRKELFRNDPKYKTLNEKFKNRIKVYTSETINSVNAKLSQDLHFGMNLIILKI